MSMSGKLVLGIVIVLAIGVLVLPSTVSLFAGQHYWYNLNDTGNQIPCEKCHADIFEELNTTLYPNGNYAKFHDFNNNKKADRTDCEACHRNYAAITYASGDNAYTEGDYAHAASVVACMLCHQAGASTSGDLANTSYAGPYAGGFNVTMFGLTEDAGVQQGSKIYISGNSTHTPYDYSTPNNPGTYEAHNKFIVEAIKNETLIDSNEACIACHTHVAVKITWKHASALEFTSEIASGNQATGGSHNWTISQWSVNTTKKFVATSWGNTTGNGSTSYWSGWPGKVGDIYSTE